ncbi:pentapeptide repeat-containing protein [Streptomyces sp. NBC_01728]|uniref:pentapeptide repeat-containing protein n=1 Tax=unclassified Streptomyces TaxID=2593676 RepID=UPI002251E288|nr:MULTISPECIES: pentapeptide repeat-containing protein [unclassified Streptomyces]MCX4462371.1 pentapeptide repeat-containing protein [Streptomyces sp. NBC_01719]MCX4500887.1 pentapeptide repeat-containing protein [Streptomyces sp. NBC_01728]
MLVTAAVAVVTLWYSSVQTRQANEQARDDRALAKEGQITDRYTAAVGNLGEDKMDVRLGGIFALQRIMQDSRRDQPTIANVLATYVRTHATKPPAKGSDVPADVQAALNILATRDISRDGTFTLDLHAVKLHKVGPVYRSPGVFGAAFGSANLSGADLSDTSLRNADLTYADLSLAYLTDAYLFHADLTGALLFRADLTGANLTGADLSRAILTHANLSRTDLTGAYLSDADLTGANLSGANLSGADLSDSFLTKQQLDSALVDDKTRLPASS